MSLRGVGYGVYSLFYINSCLGFSRSKICVTIRVVHVSSEALMRDFVNNDVFIEYLSGVYQFRRKAYVELFSNK